MSDMVVSLALDRYDRHVPFFLGTVQPPRGLKYKALEVGMVPPRRDGIERHKRMLRDLEFDAAEVSLCSYIIAKSRGSTLTGIPVFPRRLYSQNHIFVNRESGIEKPADLRGRRVGLWAFQVTMSVGVAAFPDDGKEKPALIEHADHALYHAKHSGRNQVVTYAQFTAARSKRAS